MAWLEGVEEAAPSLGLRLGLRLTDRPARAGVSWGRWTVTSRPCMVFKCSTRSQVRALLGQYGQTAREEPAPLAPAPGVAAKVALMSEGDVAPEAGTAEARGLDDAP